ncbi:MAG: hypothetical protein M3432_02620 [Chloroflexota bacterium]|nr:hypothetical protein [Chloroflexota bacterium]
MRLLRLLLVRLIVTLVVLAIVAGVAFVTVPPFATAVRTAGLLAELLEFGVRPLSATTSTPRRVTTTYSSSPAERLDIYLPADATADASRAAVVLSLGVHPLSLDHPDISRIAGGIARLGIVVGVPESSALSETRVTPDEPGRLAEAVMVMASRPEVDPARVGIAGFSAGASVGLVAAADPRIARSLEFVSAFGGYAEAETLLIDVATRTQRLGGQVIPWAAEPYVRRDISALLLAAIRPSPERDRLAGMLAPVVDSEDPPTGPDPAVLDELQDLDIRVAYGLMTAASRRDAEASLAGLSDEVRRALAAISPVPAADGLGTRVFLMHGESDRSIPISHVHLIADALPEGVLARLTTFDLFQHVQPGKDGLSLEQAPDLWQLYLYLHDLVALTTE